jgi:HEAT repeat protein
MWKDGSRAVRGSAALALEKIGTPEAIAAYRNYFDNVNFAKCGWIDSK